jgi:hypothetical protein
VNGGGPPPWAPAARSPQPAARSPRLALRQDDGYFVKLNQLRFTKSAVLPEENTR